MLSRLRETVSVIRKNNIQESKASNVRDFSFEEDIEENLPKKPRVIIGIAERYRDFFIAFERLIGFEERLR